MATVSDLDWPRCACGCGEPVLNRRNPRRRGHGVCRPVASRLVEGSAHDGECLLWQRRLDTGGYGLIKIAGRYRRVHRVAYEEWFGAIPEGFVVHHTCGVRHCLAPAHLEAMPKEEHDHKAAVCPNCGHEFKEFRRP